MQILIYSKHNCIWCDKTKILLQQYNFPYQEKILGIDYDKQFLIDLLKQEKVAVPQIMIDNVLVGGYNDLLEYFENHAIFGIQS